jgi:hypothetical protein
MIDTTKLRELAQKATPGPWTQWEGRGWVHAGTPEASAAGYLAGTYGQICRTGCDDFSDAQEIKNAEYIAAANPATVLALLDELDRTKGTVAIAGAALSAAERELDRLRTIEAAARNLAKVKGRHNSEIAMNQLLETLK